MSELENPPENQDPHAVRRLLGAGLGLGYLPIAPGTWGSAAATILAGLVFGVQNSTNAILVHPHPLFEPLFEPLVGAVRLTTRFEQILAALVACAAVYLLGVWAGNHAEADFGRKDPGPFVLDEFVGQGIAILPLLPGPMDAWGLFAAFFLFRVFDVIKPSPARELESIPGGTGIMADDVAAGAYAALCVWGLMAVGWLPG
jgi:phosphatidylglycerophosphatase A